LRSKTIENGAAEVVDFMKRFTGKSSKVTIRELGTETSGNSRNFGRAVADRAIEKSAYD
jgi:hypothetical protein